MWVKYNTMYPVAVSSATWGAKVRKKNEAGKFLI